MGVLCRVALREQGAVDDDTYTNGRVGPRGCIRG
jgi:hypothetical protein